MRFDSLDVLENGDFQPKEPSLARAQAIQNQHQRIPSHLSSLRAIFKKKREQSLRPSRWNLTYLKISHAPYIFHHLIYSFSKTPVRRVPPPAKKWQLATRVQNNWYVACFPIEKVTTSITTQDIENGLPDPPSYTIPTAGLSVLKFLRRTVNPPKHLQQFTIQNNPQGYPHTHSHQPTTTSPMRRDYKPLLIGIRIEVEEHQRRIFFHREELIHLRPVTKTRSLRKWQSRS